MVNYIKNYFHKKKHQVNLPNICRHDDIWLVSFPKSGNTWVLFLIANVINEYLSLNMEINYFNIHNFVPDIHLDRNIPYDLQYKPFRRIIKSHSDYNPYYQNVLLLIRDPRDIMISYYYYLRDLQMFDGTLSEFVRSRNFGIKIWKLHTESWLNKTFLTQRLQLLFFEDFKKNPLLQVERIFKYMGFKLDCTTIQSAVDKANFHNMKLLEKKTTSYSLKKFRDFEFVRKGKVGEGKNELSVDDLNYITKIAGELIKKVGYEV